MGIAAVFDEAALPVLLLGLTTLFRNAAVFFWHEVTRDIGGGSLLKRLKNRFRVLRNPARF